MSWTEERVDLLRKLWGEGFSASQVAAELGPGVTRNAVIGKIHRLGLAERAKTVHAPRPRVAKAPRPNPTAPRVSGGGAVIGNVALAFAPRVAPARRPAPEEVVVPMCEPVTLIELREAMCRWPLGDPSSPEFRFCGGKAPIGEGPYCGFHARVAYQPAQERRRQRDARAPRRLAG